MILNKNLLLLIIFSGTMLFSSCLSVNRNISLNKDGSGTETMTIKFGKVFYDMMASMSSLMDSASARNLIDSLYNDEEFINNTREKYSSVPGVKLLEIYSQKNEDLSNSFIIKYEFDSVQKISSSELSKFNSPEDNSSSAEVVYEKDGGKISFSYIYSGKPSEISQTPQDSLSDQIGMQVKDIFKDAEVTFEIQFPCEVIFSNADKSDGNKLTWNYSLSDAMSSGTMKLEAIMQDE